MSAPITRKATTMNRMLSLLAAAAGSLLAAAAQAAAPGISGNTITLSASPAYLTQPDGLSVYSWGYGCTGGALAAGQSFVPATTTTPFCTTMQVPGPTLVVTEGQTVTVTLTNPGGNAAARTTWGESDFRLAAAAYDHPDTCYDREYLFQFSEMDPNVHIQALAQVTACAAPGAALGCHLNVPTEPYHPVYFM